MKSFTPCGQRPRESRVRILLPHPQRVLPSVIFFLYVLGLFLGCSTPQPAPVRPMDERPSTTAAASGTDDAAIPSAREKFEDPIATAVDDLLAVESAAQAGAKATALLAADPELTANQIERLAQAELTPVRIVSLTYQALDGDHNAVREIITLSLEYSGSPACFVVATRRLFPHSLNPVLTRRHPPAQDEDHPFALLMTLQEHVDGAEYISDDDHQAWRLRLEE